MKYWLNSLLMILLVSAAAAVGFWFGHETSKSTSEVADATTTQPADEPAAPVASVQTQPLTMGDIRQTLDAYGTIQPVAGAVINIAAPYDARVERVLVTPGSTVEKDAPVAEIGPTAEGQLLFKQAQDALKAADQNLDAVRKRIGEQLATNVELAAAEQARQTAKTQLDSLQQRGEQGNSPVKSPVAGIVTQAIAQPGQVVQAGTVMIVITPPRSLEAILGVEPTVAATLQVGDAVSMRAVHASGEAEPVTGTIRLPGQQIDPQSRLSPVAVSLPADAPLLQGGFVNGEFTVQSAKGLIVPRSAILPDDEDHVLFIVVDGKAVRHVVKLGLSNREQVQVIADDLHEGDAVVVEGNAELEDGIAVEVATPATQPADVPPAAEAK